MENDFRVAAEPSPNPSPLPGPRFDGILRLMGLAVEQSPVSILVTDASGKIVYANPCACIVSGYSAEELIGQNPRILQSGLMDPAVYVELWRRIKAGLEWKGELQNRRKDGSLYWEAVSIAGVRGADGSVTHFVAVKEDITERKREHDQVARLETELREVSRLDAVGRLAGSVAHDFNNLLAVVDGCCELSLRRLAAGSPEAEWISQIRQAGQRGAELSRRLLDFGRRTSTAPAVVDVNAAVRELAALLRRLVRDEIELELELDPRRPLVALASGQFDQVLLNLVINARDAIPRGGRITISTSLSETGQIEIRVADSGRGIAPDTIGRIFEPYYTTKGSGTGIGLATVARIVEDAKGRIKVDSEVGRGSVFAVVLPAASGCRAPVPADSPQAKDVGGAETLLLVEDEPALRAVAAETLESLGYRVVEAGGGDAALGVAAGLGGAPDLLITDVVMPGISGPELARRLRSQWQSMPVLFVSGQPIEGTFDGLGLRTARLPKPFGPMELAVRVRDLLDA